MIISHVIGGIGNQMFQYATGRAHAISTGAQLKLDISDYSRYRMHQGFELERVFSAPVAYATQADIRNMLGWRSNRLVRKVLRRPQAAWLRGDSLVVEPHFAYWAGISDVASDAYLSGNWQSEKYFSRIEEVLRADFSFRPAASGLNLLLSEQMEHRNAVSLHIRRGDYVTNSHTNSVHGTSSPEYYSRAVSHIAEHVANPHFYIFSDDMDWVKNNFSLPFAHEYVGHNNGAESYNDMRLMSLCKHHIIANSSFSWWGAWLNQRTEKIVVAPRRWFADDQDVGDLFCRDWVVL